MRDPQCSGKGFDFYAQHALGEQLRLLSDFHDDYLLVHDSVLYDFHATDTTATGACGLSVERVFRCSLPKQITQIELGKNDIPLVGLAYPSLIFSAAGESIS